MIRFAVLAVIVAGCLGYLVYTATGSSAEYYQTLSEAQAHPSPGDIRVLATVRDDVRTSSAGLHVRFTAADGPATIPVEYTGALPDIFRPGIKVVVEGRVGSDGVFHARALQAKCPSRFSSANAAG